MAEPKLRVALIDDHPAVRQGLAFFIQEEQDMEVVGEAGSGEEAISVLPEVDPDVALVDLKMAGMGGLAAIRQLRAALPATEIIVFSTFAEETDISGAIEAGAAGYILKGASAQEILGAIRAAARGEAPLDPVAAKYLLERIGDLSAGTPGKLSPREREVLQLMSEGQRNKEIAGSLYITEKTVKAHVGSIFHKLQVADRTAAVIKAAKQGLVQI